MRTLWLLAMLWLAGGCNTGEPTLVIDACINPGVQAVRDSGRSGEVRCDFGRATTLVAMPLTPPSREQLIGIGFSEDAAYTLLTMGTTGPQWCTVDKEEPSMAGLPPGWQVQCVSSNIDIDRVLSVTARSVKVSIAPTATGGVRVDALQFAG
jgi:hypothetical protein